MKKYISILIVFLIVSCSDKKEFQGFWYGKFEYDETQFPVLMKFEKGSYIDYYSVPYDTLKYEIDGNNVTAYYYHPYTDELMNEYNFQLSSFGDSLSLYYPASDTKITLYKTSESNFVLDYLGDKNLNINLPKGNRKEMVLGRDFRFHRPLYLTYQNDNLVANYYDTTVIVDNEFYKFLLKQREKEAEKDWFSIPVTIISDKNVKISDIKLLKEQLSLIGLRRINYILHSAEYNKVKTLSSYIPFSEKEYEKARSLGLKLPPPPPPRVELDSNFVRKHSLLFEIKGQSILYNDTVIQEIELKKIIQEKAILDSKLEILFYLHETVVLQDYIDFVIPIYNSFYELRDQYLSEKYNDLSYYSEEKRDEAKRKYQLILGELNQKEFKKIKYNL